MMHEAFEATASSRISTFETDAEGWFLEQHHIDTRTASVKNLN
jgi:hypothetical protein